MADTAPQAFGKYALLKRIAYGGMAELHLARLAGDQGFQKLVVVKKILPHFTVQKEVVDSFIHEAKLAAQLQHENIVQVYDFGRAGWDYFIVMEYLAGQDLRRVLGQLQRLDRRMPLELSLHIVSRVCAGLDYAHDLSDYGGRPLHIVHRDVSPQNVFLTYDGQVKILDFGVAKAAGRSLATQDGVLKGKLAYMSPEQARGRPVDRRSDVFAVGLLLYEMAAGRRAFQGEQMDLLRRLADADCPPLAEVAPEVPKAVQDVVARCLAREPDARYPACREVLTDLEACRGAGGEHASAQGLADLIQDLFRDERAAEQAALGRLVGAAPGAPPAPAAEPAAEEAPTGTMPGDLSGGRRRRTGTALAAAAAGLALAAVLVWQVRAPVPRSLEAGRQAFEARRYAEAAALFQEALAQRPDLKPRVAQPYAAALRHQAAQVLDADPQQARDLLVRSLEMDGESPEGHFNLGLALLRLEALEPAREAFTRVTALQPAMADAWFNLGYVQDRLGETAGAAASYTRAVELAPPYLDEVLYNLALIEEQRGDLAACLQRLDRAVQFNPQNARVVGYRERIRQRVGADDGRN